MNGCKGSCITLAAIAGASASIAGGILAVSSATADSPTSATLAARSATPIQADRTVADSEALAVSNSTRETVEPVNVEYFEDTIQGMRHRMRTQYAQRLTREFLAATEYTSQSSPQALQGPNPCDFCASGSTFEDDQLPTASGGSGLPDAHLLDCTINPTVNTTSWRGANDHCLFPGDTLFEDPTLKEVLPDFTGINQSVQFCGTTMNIDNTCHTGDANGDSRGFDPDVWEFQITGVAALDMKMTAYAEAEEIRIAMTYNFFESTNNNTFAIIDDCSDGYGIFNFPVWQSFEIRTAANCADGTWGESLQEGYWYILCFPASENAGGPTGTPRSDPQVVDGANNPNNAWYYNVTLESVDPQGACCDTDTGVCTDGTLKSVCFASAGVFKGPGSTCADAECCSPITDLVEEIDFVENDDLANFPDAEERCDVPGATNVNEVVQDFEGNLLKCTATALTVGGSGGFVTADVCDVTDPNDGATPPNGDDVYVIVGYSGTEDNFSSSFSSGSLGQGDDDFFVFDIPGPDSVRIEAQFDVPFSYVPYLLRDFGTDPLAPDCQVLGFISPGVTGACQPARFTFCFGPGVHGVAVAPFATSNIACSVRYTIILECLECAPGACCLQDGTCTDGVDEVTCEFTLGGNFQGNYSSCCASDCVQPCTVTEVNPPNSTTSSEPDDDCTDYTCANDPGGPTACPTSPVTVTGDLFNSGCEAPDGNQASYWTTAAGAVDRLWCADTGTYILDQTGTGGIRDFFGDPDYIELDLSGETDDTQVAITIITPITLQVYIARERSRSECPSIGVDGTDDIRELSETINFAVAAGTQGTATFCLGADQHMILIETNSIIDCGFDYTIQIDVEDDCLGACCIPGGGCSNVAENSTDTAIAPPACNNLSGVYRGLGTRCPGTGEDGTGTSAETNPLGRVTEIECCTVPQETGDVIDADAATCATVISSGGDADLNGGCVQGTAAAFQSLGTLDPSSGAAPGDPGDSVAVYGTVGVGECGPPACFPPETIRDRDIYSFDIPPGVDAEMLFFVENSFNEFIRVLDPDDFDPTGACDFNTDGLSSFTINSNICDPGGQTFGVSGLQTTGQSNCLDNGQTHYIYVAAFNEPQCSVEYRFEITLFECMLGACCLDNSLCVGQNDIGLVECEAILGGTFVENASCPTGANEGTLCLGVCCIDDDMDPGTPVVCVTDTLFQECCATNGALPQTDPEAPGYAQGTFVGYQVGFDPADCTGTPCVASGACCVDDVGTGFACTDDVTPDDCANVLGGTYQGDNTSCAGTGCDSLEGACCVGTNCVADTSPLFCGGLGGSFLGAGTDCTGDPCAAAGGACCFSCPDVGVCTDETDASACQAIGGLYVGDGSTCASVNCADYCIADLDGDGDVDVFDFGVFGPNFGSGTTRCTGDFDCDGDVDVFDFGVFGPKAG